MLGVFSTSAHAQVPIDDEFASRRSHLRGLSVATDLAALPIAPPSTRATFELRTGVLRSNSDVQLHHLRVDDSGATTELGILTHPIGSFPVVVPVTLPTSPMRFDGRTSLRVASRFFRKAPASIELEFRSRRVLIGGHFESHYDRWVFAHLRFEDDKGGVIEHVYLLDDQSPSMRPWRLR